MNRSTDRTREKRLKLIVAFLCALGVVAAVFYFVLQKSAPAGRTLPLVTQDPTAPRAEQVRTARCAGIPAEIAHLDALARQPVSAASQNMLRESRRKLVDEKYELKC